ncbi:hypothetical protein BDZ97DRAFT_1791426 [Flammula alnicola]|nr:hypothetical protein BDZ97DRAFT_1791426 [Flammula alnicola]
MASVKSLGEETEALDWGNEEEEHQGAYRRASYDYAARRDSGDADDVEDTISLGEDEDDGYYYQREYTNRTVHSSVIAKEAHDRPPSVQQREESTGANDQPRSQHGYREPEHFEGATTQTSRLSASSPPRQRNSRNQSSPQHPNPTRLMHALPPKPIPAKVPYLPPSHPSIVAATSMTSISPRAASRDAKKVNGTTPGKPSSPAPPDLPQNWELRHPRRGGSPYYYNRETHESTWTLPTSRSNRDHDMEDATRPLPPDPKDLSYEDRHYRPGGDTTSVAIEVRAVARSEAIGGPYPSRSRYDRSPSPTRQRRRARSILRHSTEQDYLPSRGNHHAPRERHGFTNPDPVLQRELDAMPPESGYTERWISPPTEFDQDDRASRRQPRRPVDINDRGLDQPSSDDRTRPSLRRRESSRGPHRDRDREPPRHPDIREHSNGNPNFLSAPSTLSASSHPLPSLHASDTCTSVSQSVKRHSWRTTLPILLSALILSTVPIYRLQDVLNGSALSFFFFPSFSSASLPLTVMSSILTTFHPLSFPELQDPIHANVIQAATTQVIEKPFRPRSQHHQIEKKGRPDSTAPRTATLSIQDHEITILAHRLISINGGVTNAITIAVAAAPCQKGPR